MKGRYNMTLEPELMLIVVVFVLFTLLYIYKGGYTAKEPDITGKIINIVIVFLYVLISITGVALSAWISLFVGTDSLLYEVDEATIKLTYVMMYMGDLTPIVSIIARFLSMLFKKHNKSLLSIISQFIAIIWFSIIVILICYGDGMWKYI